MDYHSAPLIHNIENLPFPEVEKNKLDNGLPVFLLSGGSQPVVKIEVVFLAGRPYEQQKLVATTCAGLMRDGTNSFTSAQLAEKIDFYGASISTPFSFDTIKVQLYCLKKHLPELLPLLAEIIQSSIFPEEELRIFKERVKQRLAVDLSQNEIIAYRKATELFFGKDHPYGYNSSEVLYDDLDRTKIIQHYRQLFSPTNAFCLVAGQLDTNVIDQLNRSVGGWQNEFSKSEINIPAHSYPEATQIELDMGKSQTAIRIGRRLFDRRHADFAGMFVLNTALGGYFGSRLMRNLREDKGLTYGVESSLETMRFDGYLTISLETEKRHAQRAIDEIHSEISALQTSLIMENELKMVKNYLAGYLLSLIDGPLLAIEIARGNLVRRNPLGFTNDLLQKIQNVTSDELKALATKYLQIQELTQVVIH